MKKMKKFFAGLLALLMMIAVVPMEGAAAQTTTGEVIDESENGNASLTIHKYEYNGTVNNTGTGMENNTVPVDAQPLVGAGFTIYKVKDFNELKTYYDNNATELPKVSEFLNAAGTEIDSKYSGTIVESEKKTGTDGIVTFENLAFGLYVVVETTTPPAVTEAMDPFLVSIPMTTVDGDNWLYDVHVFPKNGTKYGQIKLQKTDSADAPNPLEGVTFVLQKKDVTDADNDNKFDDWINITKKAGAAGDNTGDDLVLTTDDKGLISVDSLTQGEYRFIETDLGSNLGYIMDGETVYQFTVNADGTITYDNTTAENVTIQVKNERPDMDKQVKRGDAWGHDADYNIGDKIPYQITIDVPEKITQLKTFELVDTPTNLKDDIDTIKIQYEKDGNQTDVSTGVYSIAADGNGFIITFTPDQMTDYAGKKLTISYSAELLNTAVVTVAGNPNTATLTYSNSIYPTTDADNPNNGKTPEVSKITDTAVVYTFELDIIKTFNPVVSDSSGVTFDLYKETTSSDTNKLTNDVAKALGLDIGSAGSEKYWVKVNTNTLQTDANGKIKVMGLANGTYYLVETKTLDGYNLLAKPVEVQLEIKYTTTTKTEYYKTDSGVNTFVKNEINTTTFTDTDDQNGVIGLKSQTIINKKGFTLPTTGGIGTYIFVFVGVAMMLIAAILFFTSKKKEKADDGKQ